MSTEHDREAWLRSIRGDKAAAALNGLTPEHADEQPAKPEKARACVDPWTTRVIASYTPDIDVRKALGQHLADNAMVTKAAPFLGKLAKGTVITFHTKTDPHTERIGKVVAAATDVQVREYTATDDGRWEATDTHQFIFRNQIHAVHEQFPSVEEKSDALNKSIASWLFRR